MGLSNRLAARAVASGHVLIVEVPGWWSTRYAVERRIVARGWRPAQSPADADALVVVGSPGDQLAKAIDQVWAQLPGPRARGAVTDAAAVDDVLDALARELLDTPAQVKDAQTRPAPEVDPGEMDMAKEVDMSGDMDMSGGMDMEMSPSGIPLAEGGADRDGLEMDLLHLPLGPVLPHWPAGLVLRCALQGDVVVEASAEVLDSAPPPGRSEPAPGARAARWCDEVADVLALAGWADAHAEATRTRDALLEHPEQAASGLMHLERRLRRSRLLRWSLRGIGMITDEEGQGLPPRLRGDTYARLLALLDLAVVVGDVHADVGVDAESARALPALAARLVVGLDLATARLVVASLAIRTDAVLAETGEQVRV